jgi:hypothetical protein
MAVTLDGSTPAPVYADTVATASVTSASFTPPSGSIVVAKIILSDANLNISGSLTGGLTFTSRVNAGTSNSSTRVAIYTATGAGSAVTVSAAFVGNGNARALIVEVWTGAQLAGTPATHSLVGAGSAPSDSITTAAANSVVSWGNGDWAATNGAATYRSSATQTSLHWVSGLHTAYTAYQAAASAGAQTYGLTAPTGQNPTLAAIEIQDSGGAPALPPFLTMQTRRAY